MSSEQRVQPSMQPVLRPNLVAQLDAAARGRLTVVVAPDGWGKSVLLAQWAAANGRRIAQTSFARGDDSPAVAAKILAALEPHGEPVEAAAESSFGEPWFASLEKSMAQLPESYVLFDDADVLDENLQRRVGGFVERVPAQVHVIATSRSTGLFADVADALRLRDEVAYVSVDDLAFDRDAARELLERVSGRALGDADVDTLVCRTDGWAAALECAALSLREWTDDVSVFAARFGADDPRLGAYLRTRFGRHSADVHQFLMQTAVLDRLTGPLCDSVTGRSDGHEMLQSFARDGLVRHHADHVRYHPLWRESLLNELRASDPDAEPRLLRAAGEWHLRQGEVEDAARCFIAARDWDAIVPLITANALEMFERGRLLTAVGWIESIPVARRTGDPQLTLEHASLLTMVGRTRAAEDILRTLGEPESLPVRYRAVVQALRASWVQHHASPATAIEAANDMLRLLPDLEPETVVQTAATTPASLRVIGLASRARAHWYLGDVSAARADLEGVIGSADSYRPWYFNVVGALALLEAWSGRLTLAEGHARRALLIAAEADMSDHPSMIDAKTTMGHVFRERDLLEQAEVVLAEAYDLALQVNRSTALANLAVEYGNLQLSFARPERGLEHLARFRSGGHGLLPPLLDARHRAMEARLLLVLGETNRAAHALNYRAALATAEVAGVAIELALARGDSRGARAALDAWPGDHEPGSDLACGLWSAVMLDVEGRREDALVRIASVVALAEADGHVALFLDAGADVQRLLRALFVASPSPYSRALVPPDRPVPLGAATAGHTHSLLSERELAVLRYLPSRLTNAEIADHMFLSQNTVKSHVKSIYLKLGVNGRREAIERAEELGMV